MKLLKAGLVATLLTVSPIVALAATKKTVDRSEPVAVGSVVLQPGEYRVQWDGSGPQVQVSFREGKRVLVTAPATLQSQATGYDQAIEMKARSGSETKALQAIEFKKMSLVFGQTTPSGGE